MLPAWTTPLDIARTHPIALCDCDYHYPAIARARGYSLCLVCVVYEEELRNERTFHDTEFTTAAIIRAYQRARCQHEANTTVTINNAADAAYHASGDAQKAESRTERARQHDRKYKAKKRAAKVEAA